MLPGLLAAALVVSLVTDLRSRKIYNVVTGPAFVLALAIRLAVGGLGGGPGGLVDGLLGAAVAFVPFFALAWKGGMGMGDVKLVSVVGACLGLEKTLPALFCISLVGGLQGLLALLWTGSLSQTLKRTALLAGRTLRLTSAEVPAGRRIYVPYGVAIAIGTAWAVWLDP